MFHSSTRCRCAEVIVHRDVNECRVPSAADFGGVLGS